jgi:hypothetical protein
MLAGECCGARAAGQPTLEGVLVRSGRWFEAERRQDHLEEFLRYAPVPLVVGVKAVDVAHQVVLNGLGREVDNQDVAVLGPLGDRVI